MAVSQRSTGASQRAGSASTYVFGRFGDICATETATVYSALSMIQEGTVAFYVGKGRAGVYWKRVHLSTVTAVGSEGVIASLP